MLARAIRDAMQHVWRGGSSYAGLPWRPVNDAIYRVRTSERYQKVFFGLKTRYLPTFFAVVFAYIFLALLSQGMFVVREGLATSCVPAKEPTGFENGRAVSRAAFDPKEFCWGSGIALKGGGRYRFTIQASHDWADGWIPADLYGLDFRRLGVISRGVSKTLMFLGLPFRRYIAGRWSALYARVSPKGQDVQLLSNSVRPPSTDPEQRRKAQFEFEAHRNGELFLFVNDAVPIALIYDFYGNNKGSATIQVEQLAWQHGPADPER